MRPQPLSSDFLRGGGTDPAAEMRTLDKAQNRIPEGSNIVSWKEETGLTVLQDFQGPSDGRSNDWQSVQHSFQNHHAERFIPTRHNLDVSDPVPLFQRNGG